MRVRSKIIVLILCTGILVSCSNKVNETSESISVSSIKSEATLNKTSSVNYEEYINNKIAFLTFDDGPSKNTEKILDILKKEGVKATFFVNGIENDFAKRMYKRMVDEGHTIGNHTYTHTYKDIYNSKYTFIEDIRKLDSLIFTETGYKINILRFPGGSNNTVNRKYSKVKDNSYMKCLEGEVKAMGYRYFDWTVDSTDASKVKQKTDVIVNNTITESLKQKHPIILFHDAPAKTTTVEALSKIIKSLKNNGYIIKALTYDTPVNSSFLNGKYGEILK